MVETICTFTCEQDQLVGLLHMPSKSSIAVDAGVLVIVGGPQYRVGSHRQFVLLARFLAKRGVAVFRFDCRGMGDCGGEIRDFTQIKNDVKAAIDKFCELQPKISNILIWGLCDAAAAAVFYAVEDSRVKGLILLNPWVRTESGEAKVLVKHYYWARFKNPDLWKKIFSGKLNLFGSISTLAINIGKSLEKKGSGAKSGVDIDLFSSTIPLPERLLLGLSRFDFKVLIILSGNDFTADEFRELVVSSSAWRELLSSDQFEKLTLMDANHTFSKQEWRAQVSQWTLDWITSNFSK